MRKPMKRVQMTTGLEPLTMGMLVTERRTGVEPLPMGMRLLKRTTGVEPATFGLGSRRSTN